MFVHLALHGANVAQNDGLPRYFVKYAAADALARRVAVDWRRLPSRMQPYPRRAVGCGLYDPASGARAAVIGENGTVIGDDRVGRSSGGRAAQPDQACAPSRRRAHRSRCVDGFVRKKKRLVISTALRL